MNANNSLKILSIIFISSLIQADVCTPCKPCISDLYLAIDYLHWKAEGDQLQYALNIPGGFNKDGLVFSDQIFIEQPCFKNKSGVRTVIGFAMGDNWDARALWTHYNNNPFTQIVGDPRGIFASPALGLLDTGGLIGSAANTNWCLRFNTIDLELAQNWLLCESVILRPFLGFKWAQIKQRQDISYLGIENIGLDLIRINNFHAIGPRIGLDEKWYVWRDFSVIGTISTALVYGTFNVNVTNIISAEGVTDTLHPTFIECKKRLRPTLQILVGFGWDTLLYDDTLLEISAAFEAQQWWNQWQAPTTFATLSGFTPNGDLMLHGLTFHFGIKF